MSTAAHREDVHDAEKAAIPTTPAEREDQRSKDSSPAVAADLDTPPIARNPFSTARSSVAGAIMLLTYFLGAVSGQAVTVAIPTMADDLQMTELETQWVVSAYTLSFGCGLLFCGRIADIYGRKPCYLLGLLIFCLFNILSGIIKNPSALFVMRAFSGIGLALAGPSGFGLISENVTSEPARSRVFAAFGLGGPIGASTGTLLGGGITGINITHSWSLIFYILAGLSAIPFTLGIWIFPGRSLPDFRGVNARIDWIGGIIMAAGLSLFMFSLVQSGSINGGDGWKIPYVPVLFVLSIGFLVSFFLWERFVERKGKIPPAAKVSLFTRGNFRFMWILLASFFTFFAASGWVYCATIWYQNLQGESPLRNAILLLPCNLLGIIAGFIAMFLSSRLRAPLLIVLGAALSGIASLLYAVLSPSLNYWASGFVAQLFLPWGIDFTICIGNILVANWSREDEKAVAGALYQTSYTVGSSAGVALGSLIIQSRQNAGNSLHQSLQVAFGVMTAMAWGVIALVAIGLRRVGVGKDEVVL